MNEWPPGTVWMMVHGGIYFALRGSLDEAKRRWDEAMEEKRRIVDFYGMLAEEGFPDPETVKVLAVRTDYIITMGQA